MNDTINGIEGKRQFGRGSIINKLKRLLTFKDEKYTNCNTNSTKKAKITTDNTVGLIGKCIKSKLMKKCKKRKIRSLF